ncbi:DivIVA domain-containing protein [Brevibacterium sp. p3-SID960]|uniref:DivIVA domain-containing protein n=1 Tax=Brevibacterium sp. p3-SID960 TaxID=2916063 RepID=UPI0021A6238E|nr:DivIVA domain-containing protein [Brevibacterium sp. p3-SID960]MCT1690574.1 DivIVA domain-containing protein [Brevibacterium sp. p3-SID960]
MSIYIILGVCAVVFFAVVAIFGATGGFNSAMGRDQAQEPPRGLGKGWSADDISAVRFQLAARGYRTDAVDLVLEQMTQRLREQEAEIARLHAERDHPHTGHHRLGNGCPETVGDPQLGDSDRGIDTPHGTLGDPQP